MLTIHASRSRYETFQTCSRMGYLQYHWGGKGLQRKGKNLYLTTGSWTHKGLELILRWVKANNRLPSETILDSVVAEVTKGYRKEVFGVDSGRELSAGIQEGRGFDLIEEGEDWSGVGRPMEEWEKHKLQLYTFNEQSALTEAFLRVFCLKILPGWWQQYKVVTVENDMAFPFESDLQRIEKWQVIQSATIDVVLQDRISKDLMVGSFKTAGRYDNRQAKSNAHDTQGLSETWAFEEYLRSVGKGDKKVAGVLMLYFVKGQRKETKYGNGIWETNSPLIKGYRRIGPDGVEYAHSWWYPKPENESGSGYLGKGWEKFNVWESTLGDDGVGGVKGWVRMLASGEVQPECGDILEACLRQPEPYYRRPEQVDSWLRQTKAEEGRNARKLVQLEGLRMAPGGLRDEILPEVLEQALDELFPQNRRACHYPGDCRMLPLCHGTPEERFNPLENGYTVREPHHEAERKENGKV